MVTFAHYQLMSNGRKNSLKYSSALILCVLFFHLTVHSQDSLSKKTDTSSVVADTSIHKTDTLHVNLSKDSLDAPIIYSASDSVVFVIPDKKIIFYSKGDIKQKDAELTADSLTIDQGTNLVTAVSRRDSAGHIVSRPKMVQAGSTTESDVIKYNTKSQKGLTYQSNTQQGEIFIHGQTIKKVNQNDFYAYKGQFTTCNLDTPHFAFVTKKLKLVNKKLAVSGPIHPEFEGVPIPIYIPFGIFPISQGRHSGFLPPTLATGEQYGLGVQGIGYYKVLNDNFDVTARADIYSYGGYAMYFEPSYRVRYKYNGGLRFTLQRTRILSSDAKEDFTDTKTFNLSWRHSVDSKARPGTNFSANVNAGSTKFNRYILNNPMANYNNQLNSSIAYSKTWDGYNLTVSANHSQNNNTGLVNLNLPTVGFTANTIYPLQRKDFAGTPKWYEKLGIGLNSNFSNQINFYDSLFSFKRLIDTLQWGAQHTIPIQLSLPAVGPVQISPGISYGERWFSRSLVRTWDSVNNKVDSNFTKGFYQSRDVSFSLSLSTAIFGKFDKFGKNSRLMAIRHVIRPSVSFNFKPDLAGKNYQKNVQITPDTGSVKAHYQNFSKYEGGIYGDYSQGTFGGIGFGIDNNIEAKVRSKKDTGAAAIKKIKLLDGFGFTGSYNLLADSFKLSPVTFYIRSTLFDKVNITAGTTLDPYQVDSLGFRTKAYAWSNGKFSPGRITNGNIAISTSFKSKAKDDKKDKALKDAQEGQTPLTMDEQMAQMEYIRQNPAEFADFNVPWSVNISYSLSFLKRFKTDYSGFETVINSSASINGDFNLTPRWKTGINTYYDFKTAKIQTLTMFISREMHCWQLSINVTPVGLYRSFNITINPKSGILRDLKINRTRQFYGG
jgi:LPS-assembly protein